MSSPQVVFMRRFPPFVVSLLLLCLSVSAAAAQTPALEIGTRVRLSSPVYRGTAVISDQSADELTLRVKSHAAPVVVPWSTISVLAAPQRRSRGQGARNGTKWGLGIGLASYLLYPLVPGGVDETQTPASLVAANAVVGVGIGALVGALRPGRVWRNVDVPSAQEAARHASPRTSAAAASDSAPVPDYQAAFPHEGATPQVEMTIGFSGISEYAQFPLMTASLAINRARNFNQGAALVTELDVIAAFTRGLMAGPRVYGRSAPLFGEVRTLTYFGQVLVGAVLAEESGVIRSNGGFGIQPGVGADWGRGAGAFRVQLSYRIVPGGVIEDSRLAAPQIATLSELRFLVGYTKRYRCKGADLVPCG